MEGMTKNKQNGQASPGRFHFLQAIAGQGGFPGSGMTVGDMERSVPSAFTNNPFPAVL
jgi:hypothetical protein